MLGFTRNLVGCAIVLLLTACAGSPGKKPDAGASIELTNGDARDDADVQLVLQGVQMIQGGQIMAAIDGPLHSVVGKYEAAYANTDAIVYSARGPSDALLYAAMSPDRGPHPTKVLVLGPAWAMAYWASGYAYNEMARYDDAVDALRKALQRAPLDSQYNIEIGFAYQGKRQWDESLAHYKAAQTYASVTAADIPDTTCKALRGQGFALTEMHRFEEARAAYHACLKLIRDEPRSLAELKYIDEQTGKAPAATAAPPGSPQP